MKKITDSIIVFFFFLIGIYAVVSVSRIITTNAPDFVVLYKSTEDLINGINPYTDKNLPDVYLYPTATAFFYIPFVFLPYQYGQGLFVTLSALSVPFVVYFTLKIRDAKFSWRYFILFTSFAFLSFPVKFTLGMGQSNLLAVFLLIVGFYFYRKSKYLMGGILVCLAFFFKPILSFTILFFVLMREWQMLGIVFASAVVLIASSSILYGFDMYLHYTNSLLPSLLLASGSESYYNQGFTGFVARLTENTVMKQYIPLLFTLSLVSIISYVRLKRKIDAVIYFAAFVAMIPLIHKLSWQHHFAILMFPFIVTAVTIVQTRKYQLFVLLFLSYILVSWNIKDPLSIGIFPMNFVLAHTFFGGLILLLLLLYFLLKKK